MDRVESIRSQIRKPMKAMAQPKYKADDQPSAAAMMGVVMGAIRPPTLPPAFRIPHAAPTCSPAMSMVPVQKATSETAEKPNANAISVTAAVTPDVLTAA